MPFTADEEKEFKKILAPVAVAAAPLPTLDGVIEGLTTHLRQRLTAVRDLDSAVKAANDAKEAAAKDADRAGNDPKKQAEAKQATAAALQAAATAQAAVAAKFPPLQAEIASLKNLHDRLREQQKDLSEDALEDE